MIRRIWAYLRWLFVPGASMPAPGAYTTTYKDIPGDLGDLNDIDITAGDDDDFLLYDAAAAAWQDRTPTQAMAALSGQAAAPFSMNAQRIIELADAQDPTDAVNLRDVLDHVGVTLNYWLSNQTLIELLVDSEAALTETPASTPETLSTITFKSSVADTPTPFDINPGTVIELHFSALVAAGGGRNLGLHVVFGYMDSDSANFIQIGDDSDSTGALTTDKTAYTLHMHVPTAIDIPAGKRLWLKFVSTSLSGGGVYPQISVYYDNAAHHLIFGVAGSVLLNFVQKALFDANTILAANSDNTPAPLTIAEQRVVGRITAGNVAALTGANLWTILTGQAGAAVSLNAQDLRYVGHIGAGDGTTGASALRGIFSNDDYVVLTSNQTAISGYIGASRTGSTYTLRASGGDFSAFVNDLNTQNWTNAVGLCGILSEIGTFGGNPSLSTITGAAAFYVAPAIISIAANDPIITNYYGLYVVGNNLVGNSKLTNCYGIYIGAQAGGATLNYAIYTAGAPVYHVGDLTAANIITAGNVDGRDVSVDGSKLDGIEALADVTGSNAPQAHQAEHRWGGSDELDVGGLLLTQRDFQYIHWRNIDGMTDASDTGSVTPGFVFAVFETSGTQGKTAHMYANSHWFVNRPFAAGRLWLMFKYQTATTNVTAVDIWVGLFLTPATPTTTQKHAAFHVKNGDSSIWASSGDGTTEEETDTGINISQFQGRKLLIRMLEDRDEFYIDDILKATHETNLADASNVFACFYIKNTGVAAAEGFNLFPTFFNTGAE